MTGEIRTRMTMKPALMRLVTSVIALILIAGFVFPGNDVDSLIARCRQKLKESIDSKKKLMDMIKLVEEIEKMEDIYLKSSHYPDVRLFYKNLMAKLGDYYLRENNFNKAVQLYTKADKYSLSSYKIKIETAKKKKSKKALLKLLLMGAISNYNNGNWEQAKKEFLRMLKVTPQDPKRTAFVKKYLSFISILQNNSAITPRAYLRFKQKHPAAPFLSNLKETLYRKFPNLPPEHYLEKVKRKNCKGYWEIVMNDHIMIYIPSGNNRIKSFLADKYEVSQYRFNRLKSNTGETKDITVGSRLPARVTFEEAGQYCKTNGFRLPTATEWCIIAGIKQGFTYPWGNMEVNHNGIYRANYDDGVDCEDGYAGTAPVNSFENFTSPYGIVNLAGNTWEWLQDGTCKGGGFLSKKDSLKINAAAKKLDSAGFRCVKDIEERIISTTPVQSDNKNHLEKR